MKEMKFIAKYVLISFIVFRASHEVQGKSIGPNLENEGNEMEKESAQVVNNIEETSNTMKLEENDLRNGNLLGLSKSGLQSLKTRPSNSEENTNSLESRNHDFFHSNQTKRIMLPFENRSLAARSYDSEILISKHKSFVIKPPIAKALPIQRIYCRQTTKTEVNDQGELVEIIQHKCAPLETTTYKVPPSLALPLSKRENNIGTTPKGINCRRVMNSEFNDLGEIVDSVAEICDPPPTTTTTTRKPFLYTWPRTTTTTPLPLIKVCRPVMDSYLNEDGKIIDSVSIFCKMEQVSKEKEK